MSKSDYKPIACAIYDHLILYIQHKSRVNIVYDSHVGERERVVQLKDLHTRAEGEFLELSSGEEIRLDKIISVKEMKD